MFRFRLSTFLVAVAVIAIWLASGTFEDGIQVRRMAWLLFLVICFASVLFYRGARQAFWIGVGFVLIFRLTPQNWAIHWELGPQDLFAGMVDELLWGKNYQNPEMEMVRGLISSTVDVFTFSLVALTAGAISASIYRHAKATSDGSN